MQASVNLPRQNIPITVFTGFLGAGKTSIILSLLPQLPKDYRVVLLKNEFGDVEVDSQLAKQSSLTAVSEILNGCMCCVLVGQMKTALLEIREKYRPDRIIIECSGSAFPATLAFQIRELERETEEDLKLDAIVTVIDAENFKGYEDTSPTAKMQASYSDIILINKSEHVSERELDLLIDRLNTLNDSTPKIRCEGRQGVDPNLIFGLDSKLFREQDPSHNALHHEQEVETVTVTVSNDDHTATADEHSCSCDASNHAHYHREESVVCGAQFVNQETLTEALQSLSKEAVWRVKGFATLERGVHILNWAFGRFELHPLIDPPESGEVVKLTFMGERGEVKRWARKFAEGVQGRVL